MGIYLTKAAKALVGAALVVVGTDGSAGAMDLQRRTIGAWEEYIRGADLRAHARLDAHRSFLWVDESQDRILRLRRGEIVVAPAISHGTLSVPNALIHDWIGAVFIPGTMLESLFTVMHDYDRYKEIYKPVVAASRALTCAGTDQEFSMVWQQRVLFVNAAMESRYQSRDVMVDSHRGYSIADTAQVQEIEDYGRSTQRILPPDTGNGFIWRLHSITRYEQRDGGVYLELEAIALTRDIPASLHWFVNPVVTHLSMNSMATTLQQTRAAMNSLPAEERRVSCPNRTRSFARALVDSDN
jgi:hypothetical protein